MILAVTFSFRTNPEPARPYYVSRPNRPPRADGMGGAEVGAPEAGDAEVHAHGEYLVVHHPEHPHGAHIEADPVVAAEVTVDVYLNGNRPGR